MAFNMSATSPASLPLQGPHQSDSTLPLRDEADRPDNDEDGPMRRRRGPMDGLIPKVTDETGETVQQTFEVFIER